MTCVLLAPDKFKGSLTAAQVATALRQGLLDVAPEATVRCVPVADGGDGTVDAAVAGGFTRVPITATGPTGEPVRTSYARKADTAVIEMADVSGLSRLPGRHPAPLSASSYGTGEVIDHALRSGCRRIVLGIGGSASTDGGLGLVCALGAVARDHRGEAVPFGGAHLGDVAHLDLARMRDLSAVELVVACDVDNPLFGERGAAVVYGPQKGADPHQVRLLDSGLRHWASVVKDATGQDLKDEPGAGAAGGVGFAAVALLGARLRPGIDLVLELLDFDRQLADANLVVVGEGSLDEQTLRGKAPAGVARAARSAGVPVVAVCGRRTLGDDELTKAGIGRVHTLTELEPDTERCMTEAAALLVEVGRRLAADLPRH